MSPSNNTLSWRSRQWRNKLPRAAIHPSMPTRSTVGPFLLGIPQECRDMILRMLLENKSKAWDGCIIDKDIQSIYLHIPWVGGNGGSASSYKISGVRINIGNVNVLRTCRQLRWEGAHILYGGNAFISYNFPQLKYRLHTIIGRTNMKFMQRVTIGLPMKHKRDPTAFLGGFLEFFKERLPNLTELNLTTQFYRFDKPLMRYSNNTRIGEEFRAMLNTSAWVTCRHPRLKKAVWLVESGGTMIVPLINCAMPVNTDMDDGASDGSEHGSESDYTPDESDNGEPNFQESHNDFLQESSYDDDVTHDKGIKDDNNEDDGADDFGRDMTNDVHQCRLTVKILAEDRRFKIREQVRIDLIPRITKVIAKDIILDCRAIRRTLWADLLVRDPRDFALDENATSSEPPKPVVIRSRDHNGMIYANYEIVDDYLRDRFKYLSLKDKNRLTPKEVASKDGSSEVEDSGGRTA